MSNMVLRDACASKKYEKGTTKYGKSKQKVNDKCNKVGENNVVKKKYKESTKSIYNRKVLSVCLSRKMITFPNGLKSSSLAVTIFVKHCNKKMFSMNCMCEQNLFGELLIF